MNNYICLFCLSVNRNLDWFQYLTIMNYAAVNTGIQLSANMMPLTLLRKYLKGKYLHKVSPLRIPLMIPIVFALVYISNKNIDGFLFIYRLINICY